MVSGPGLALASRMACAKVPRPELFVFVTTKVFAGAAAAKMNNAAIAVTAIVNQRATQIFLITCDFIGVAPLAPLNSFRAVGAWDVFEIKRKFGSLR
jgi:hypothetical protein